MQAEQTNKRIDIESMLYIAAHEDFAVKVWLAAREYVKAGMYVVPLERNSKKLPLNKDLGITYAHASSNLSVMDKWFHPTDGKFSGWNVGIATGRTGGVFAIDVDRHGNDDGFINLEELENKHGKLPDCPIQTTPNGGRHYLFQWQEHAMSSTSKIAKSIDTRGGNANACKGHIVAFPSVVNGKQYQWVNGGPVPYIPKWVMEKMGVTWRPPKSKNRGNENVTDSDVEAKIPLDQVERMLSVIDPNNTTYEDWLRIGMAIKSQYPGDDGLSLWNKWSSRGERYKNNECVNRWGGFSESGSVRIGSLFYYAKESGWQPQQGDIKGNKFSEIIERINKHHAIVVVGGKIKVLRELEVIDDPILGHYDLLEKDTFKTLFQNDTTTIEDSRGNPKQVGVADLWLASESRRTYKNGMRLCPNGNAPDGYYNTWNGFSVTAREGDCSLLLDHIRKVICGNDINNFNFLIDWCADAVQDPANPKGVCVVMRGPEGVGKGTLASTMGELFGTHYRHLIDDSHLLSNFNAHMIDALFVFADEITWGGNKKTSGKLKGLVTERYLVGERKGVDAVGYRNMVRMMIASNSDWVIPAGSSSRRWFVLDVANDRIKDRSYYAAINDQLDHGGREAFLFYLLNREITCDLRRAPETKALFEQRARSAHDDSILQWWLHCINSSFIDVPPIRDTGDDTDWPSMCNKHDLYKSYERWCMDRRRSIEVSDVFFKKMRIYGMSDSRPTVGNKRVYAFRIPIIEVAANELLKIGHRVSILDEE